MMRYGIEFLSGVGFCLRRDEKERSEMKLAKLQQFLAKHSVRYCVWLSVVAHTSPCLLCCRSLRHRFSPRAAGAQAPLCVLPDHPYVLSHKRNNSSSRRDRHCANQHARWVVPAAARAVCMGGSRQPRRCCDNYAECERNDEQTQRKEEVRPLAGHAVVIICAVAFL